MLLPVYPHVYYLGLQTVCNWPNSLFNSVNKSTTLNEVFWPFDFFLTYFDIISDLKVAKNCESSHIAFTQILQMLTFYHMCIIPFKSVSVHSHIFVWTIWG